MKKKLSVHDHESFKPFPFFILQVFFFGGGEGVLLYVGLFQITPLFRWHLRGIYKIGICNFKSGLCFAARFKKVYSKRYGPGSSVGIATDYGLDGPGSSPDGGEIFRTSSDRPWGPPSLLYNGYRVFPGGKERPGRDPDPSPLLVPWSRKSRAIPLLPLWAVWPVQNLSACTRVHFTFTFTAKGKGRPVTCHSGIVRGNRGVVQPMLNHDAR